MRRYAAPLASLLLLLAAAAAGVYVVRPAVPPKPAPEVPLEQKIARALSRGVEFLLRQQSDDGAWRSDSYGTFKDGTALTPLALNALQDADHADAGPRLRAARFLSSKARPDGSVDEGPVGLDYPVYTAALSVRALSREDAAEFDKPRDAWLKFLLARQLTEQNGWSPADYEYGGWGYCRTIPKKPEPGNLAPPLVESNLSATVFALDALHAAGHPDAARNRAAGRYVLRMQNRDGGFHFIDGDPVRNKAGIRGHAISYGSSTADGVRGLLRTGQDPAAGRAWLVEQFRADVHPGEYLPSHESNRNAVYFYYAASVSETFHELNVKNATGGPWAPALAAELSSRQATDGSWTNPVSLVREDDPVTATCWAVTALANCRKAMAVK
jgi:hypothetical protein